ncbi:sugar-non-specific nuclease inhibitor NuiA-like protein [Pontibacter diazotrophicus]|uniref:Sugar-non-specific nuclease inhibitor NuiA-like protein n=1 Tax=Pontibacter diazotrophicus TaxID=1400979 RepID=A0A3D8LHJ6_9BACT|nr:nuclease A inhibitor family protein [Pontibacter diazotrophicus]RDV16724.1 sugar-non-specific nuclease inhibitor NuiA-like protein [Pontibacter diazotrophicus]
MNNSASASTSALLEQFRAASDGLLYRSETDAPFEVVHFPQVQDSSALPAAIAQLPDMPEGVKAEVVELPYFFRNMVGDDPDAGEEEVKIAQRFRELQELLEQRLQEVKVYKVGKRRIQALVLGKTATGDYAGLKTTLVET